MNKLRSLWHSALPEFPVQDIEEISRVCSGEMYEASACFWLFRYLHRAGGADALLFGDYCFGRFSEHLSVLDDVPLTDAFAEYLRRDTLEAAGLDTYLRFLRGPAEWT